MNSWSFVQTFYKHFSIIGTHIVCWRINLRLGLHQEDWSKTKLWKMEKWKNGKNKWSERLIWDLVFTKKGNPKSDTWTGIHIFSWLIDQIWAQLGLHQAVWSETRHFSRNTCVLSSWTNRSEPWSSSAGLVRDPSLSQNMHIKLLGSLVFFLVFTMQTGSKPYTLPEYMHTKKLDGLVFHLVFIRQTNSKLTGQSKTLSWIRPQNQDPTLKIFLNVGWIGNYSSNTRSSGSRINVYSRNL